MSRGGRVTGPAVYGQVGSAQQRGRLEATLLMLDWALGVPGALACMRRRCVTGHESCPRDSAAESGLYLQITAKPPTSLSLAALSRPSSLCHSHVGSTSVASNSSIHFITSTHLLYESPRCSSLPRLSGHTRPLQVHVPTGLRYATRPIPSQQ